MQKMDHNRRAFLRFLAASPLLSGIDLAQALDDGEAVEAAADAIDIFDLHETVRGKLPPAHYGYMATGTNGDGTLRANRTAFDKFYLRSRRLVDVSNIDTRINILGRDYASPIVLCPVSSQKAFHPEGEVASARAAKRRGHLQILSNVSSTGVEDVSRARGEPVWQQLYPTMSWPVAKGVMARAEAAGCPAIVLTVDLPGTVGVRNTLERAIRRDTRDCAACHENPDIAGRTPPMYDGLTIPSSGFSQASLTWEFIDRMRNATDMKILVKGIVTAEDAELCIEYGVDGIIVSNHGGRADDSGIGAIESLAEVAGAVRGRTTILMDSGVRRGTDIVKALALGADAVAVGRPYVWGLGSFGEAGVDRALEILQYELEATMEWTGTPSLANIGSDHIGRHA